MRNELIPPFQFDISRLIAKLHKKFSNQVGSVSVNLPFVSFTINPNSLEKKIAKEIVIRMADKRVLNAFECCDSCINNALISLQEIRKLLVDKQVELANNTDSALYLLIELQLEAIRQFLTFEQKLNDNKGFNQGKKLMLVEKDKYFAGLEMLRAHLYRCLLQISKVADIKIPKIVDHMRYDEAWQLEAYKTVDTKRIFKK